jgi:hypothetical protein
MEYMFQDVTLSTTNYDNLLEGWANLPLQSGNNFHGGNSHFSNTSARDYIINNFGWTIIDGGPINFSPSIITSSEVTVTQNSNINSQVENSREIQTSYITSPPNTSSNSINFGIILILAIVFLIGWLLVKPKSTKSDLKRKLSSRTPQDDVAKIIKSSNLCIGCGVQLSLDDVYCSECGVKT